MRRKKEHLRIFDFIHRICYSNEKKRERDRLRATDDEKGHQRTLLVTPVQKNNLENLLCSSFKYISRHVNA